MGVLSRVLEATGLTTVGITLVREHTDKVKPPRALWVPFMMGRPFGAPNAPDFQRKVLRALLGLFECASGPVLKDFPDDAPPDVAGETTFACPVSFAPAQTRVNDPAAAMRQEIAQLAPWYELALKRRGRTTVGVSGLGMNEAADFAASYAGETPAAPYDAGLSPGIALKRVCDDLKAYHYEAVAAQPGNLSPKEIDKWFWFETATAKVFLAIRDACLRSEDKSLQPLGRLTLVPRAVGHALNR